MDCYRNIRKPFVVFHRILKKLVCDITHSVPDFLLAALVGGYASLGWEKRSYIVAQEIRGQAIVTPTGLQRRIERGKCQRQVFTFAGRCFVVAESLANHSYLRFSSY